MRILSLFDNSNDIRDSFINQGFECISLDICSGYIGDVVDIKCNILDFDYKIYPRAHFNYLYIALPCQCYSIASGQFHFKKSIPVTSQAINAINILIKIWQITQYFKCHFMIENPSGGLVNNLLFKSFFNLNVTRISLGNFGFKTQKKTDLFHSDNSIYLSNPIYRKNGVYNKNKISNMSYRQRVKYPVNYVTWITSQIATNLNH